MNEMVINLKKKRICFYIGLKESNLFLLINYNGENLDSFLDSVSDYPIIRFYIVDNLFYKFLKNYDEFGIKQVDDIVFEDIDIEEDELAYDIRDKILFDKMDKAIELIKAFDYKIDNLTLMDKENNNITVYGSGLFVFNYENPPRFFLRCFFTLLTRFA